ncbi:hypothetical protein IFM89_007159 [Coptis chinensis]|uniref:Uncharacterized protein n=1 Tax=Coptis chinensis TaxID=261450 RepID=A0A835HB73_9MAGN|nr:hypothetical protein IFM89_007159 [Coptis chinensis]
MAAACESWRCAISEKVLTKKKKKKFVGFPWLMDWLIIIERIYNNKILFSFWNRFSRSKKLLLPAVSDEYHKMLYSNIFCNGCFYFVKSDFSIYTIDAEAMISLMKEVDIPWETSDTQQFRNRCLRRHQVAIPTERATRAHVWHNLVESCMW